MSRFSESRSSSGGPSWKLIGGALLLIGAAVATFIAIDITTVRGNQIGVKETWTDGVKEEVYQPRTYFLFPGWTQNMYTYDMTPQIYVMNNREHDERANGRKNDAYVARSLDNQTMIMEFALQWHYDPAMVIQIHKRYKTHSGVGNWADVIEERVIRQNLISAANVAATQRKAIDAYSGEGFVKMQQQISDTLTSSKGELRTQGIVIDTFVIEKITLADDYIGEINKRQVAEQRELRANKEEQAALAEARRAKAEAASDYEKQLVEARREKEKQILASEADAQQQINQATAAARKVILQAEAERDAAVARAQAITAIGAAEAEAQKLKLSAYAVPGADNWTQIQIADSMSRAFGGIQGYLPSDMKINLLTGSFTDAVRGLMHPEQTPAKK